MRLGLLSRKRLLLEARLVAVVLSRLAGAVAPVSGARHSRRPDPVKVTAYLCTDKKKRDIHRLRIFHTGGGDGGNGGVAHAALGVADLLVILVQSIFCVPCGGHRERVLKASATWDGEGRAITLN